MIQPIVMAGGSGSRLWPLSRSNYPKQFLKLISKYTMLQDTLMRIKEIDSEDAILICNEEHRFIAAEQLREIDYNHNGIILEPFGRNTAPAIALSAFKAIKSGKDPVLLVLAADHMIKDTESFLSSVLSAKQYADNDKLITFGVKANTPETGYGYIKMGMRVGEFAHEVIEFVEKPSLDKAEAYIQDGNYVWNSGMFMFKASTYLNELQKHSPKIYESCRKAMEAEVSDLDFIRIDEKEFNNCPEDSIDYALMEKTKEALVVPIDSGWSDVGGFSTLWDVSEKDNNGNVFRGDIVGLNTKKTFVDGGDKLVATIGLENLIIVNTKDALLVADKDKSQEIKAVVNKLRKREREEAVNHREVYRPWGKYDSIDSGSRFQVKRITVRPGAKLSVQMHHHRAEHWIVVSGTAKVTNGEKELLLTENQSTYIPVGVVHALENPGKVDLELIEVQSGSYLGEDDIVRFEDNYGRV